MAPTYPAMVSARIGQPSRPGWTEPRCRRCSANSASVSPLYTAPPACIGSTKGQWPDASMKSSHLANAVASPQPS
eukprot:4631765-Pleurochrysis_carterae.AAC.1